MNAKEDFLNKCDDFSQELNNISASFADISNQMRELKNHLNYDPTAEKVLKDLGGISPQIIKLVKQGKNISGKISNIVLLMALEAPVV